MTTILGINAAFHDSSACLVQDGRVVAAVEERLLRQKHHKRATPFNAHALPFQSIHYCLSVASLQLSAVTTSPTPLTRFSWSIRANRPASTYREIR